MKIILNGKPMDVPIGQPDDQESGTTTLRQLVEQILISGQKTGIAVALNDEVIPKHEWQTTTVRAGDRVEIVHAVQGG